MKQIQEKYFPLMGKFSARVANWRRRLNYRSAPIRHRGKYVVKVDYVFAAPFPCIIGKRIAFISDLHWQDTEENRAKLTEITDFLHNKPVDYLVLGGDMVGDAVDIPSLESILPLLAAAAPTVLAVGGNWEIGKRWLPKNFWREMYRRHDIIYLENEVFEDDHFHFSGIADVSSGIPKLPAKPAQGKTAVILTHSPDTIIALDTCEQALADYHLVLCGHTHGGQIRLPLLGALSVPSRYGRRFDCGVFKRRKLGVKMAVSTGVGELSCSKRWNCRRELTYIHFRLSHHQNI